MVLQDYITRLQRLLHDTQYAYYTQQQLTDYINEARGTIAYQTSCLKQSQFLDTIVGQNQYSITGMIDVNSIFLNYNNYNYTLTRYPYNIFKNKAYNLTLQGMPSIWATQNYTLFVYPVPDQVYTLELFGFATPQPLVNLTDVDAITFPFTDLVPYYAAYLANLYAQRIDKAAVFLQMYNDRKLQIEAGTQRVRHI